MINAQPVIHETKRKVHEDGGIITGLVIYEADLESRTFEGRVSGDDTVECGTYELGWKAVASSERKFDITCTETFVPKHVQDGRRFTYSPSTDERIKKYITEEILRYESGEK